MFLDHHAFSAENRSEFSELFSSRFVWWTNFWLLVLRVSDDRESICDRRELLSN
jgi:hypothetical protein